jgi:hypothetical protein
VSNTQLHHRRFLALENVALYQSGIGNVVCVDCSPETWKVDFRGYDVC